MGAGWKSSGIWRRLLRQMANDKATMRTAIGGKCGCDNCRTVEKTNKPKFNKRRKQKK